MSTSQSKLNALVTAYLNTNRPSSEIATSIISMGDLLDNLTEEQALEMLDKMTNKERKATTYSKPLWNDSVKKSCSKFIEELDFDAIERSVNFLKSSCSDEIASDDPDYPFCSLLSKWMFAFGDYSYPTSELIKCVHHYLNKWFVALLRQLSGCEWRKAVNHIFSREMQKFTALKKFKLNSSLRGVDEIEDELANDESEELLEDLFNDEKNQEEQEKFERLLFNEKRTSKMTEDEYIAFTHCKTLSFQHLSYKKKFQNYLNGWVLIRFSDQEWN